MHSVQPCRGWDLLLAILESDDVYYLEPVFVQAQAPFEYTVSPRT